MTRAPVLTHQLSRFAAALLAFAPLSQLSAQGDADSTISKQKPVVVLERHHAGVTSVKFSPNGSLLASADLNGDVILWQTGTWIPLRTLHHGGEVYAVAFSPDGKTIASTGGDQRVVLWNATNGNKLRSFSYDHRAPSITFASNGDLLIDTEDGTVHFVNPTTGKEIRTMKAGGSGAAVAVSSDTSTIATALPIRVWDYSTFTRRSSQQSLGQLGLALSSNGKRLASAESTGGALLWKLDDSVTYVPLRATVEKKAVGARGYESFSVNMPVSAIDMTRNADRIIGGGTTGLVYIWTPAGSQPPQPVKLAGHTMTVTAVALSPNGELIASGSLDRTIRIWTIRP